MWVRSGDGHDPIEWFLWLHVTSCQMVYTEATGRNYVDQPPLHTFLELPPAWFLLMYVAFVSPFISYKHWPLLSMSTSSLLALGRGEWDSRQEGLNTSHIYHLWISFCGLAIHGFTVTGIHSVEIEPQPAVILCFMLEDRCCKNILYLHPIALVGHLIHTKCSLARICSFIGQWLDNHFVCAFM